MKLLRVYTDFGIPTLRVENNGFNPYGSELRVQSGPLLLTISMITGGLQGDGENNVMPERKRSSEVLALMEKWN